MTYNLHVWFLSLSAQSPKFPVFLKVTVAVVVVVFNLLTPFIIYGYLQLLKNIWADF